MAGSNGAARVGVAIAIIALILSALSLFVDWQQSGQVQIESERAEAIRLQGAVSNALVYLQPYVAADDQRFQDARDRLNEASQELTAGDVRAALDGFREAANIANELCDAIPPTAPLGPCDVLYIGP